MIKRVLLLTFGAYLIVGCGDTTSLKEEPKEEIASVASFEKIEGRVVDGEISDATVFFDKNRNGLLDENETSTKTDAKGYFSLNIESSDAKDYTVPIVAFGGKDIRLNSDFEEVLMGFREKDSNSLNITPLSTLVAHDVLDKLIDNESKTSKYHFSKITSDELFSLLYQAQESFANIFSLDINILTKDPVEIALSGNLELLKTNTNINRVSKEIKKAIKDEIKDAKRDAIRSYRALSRALKEANREAKKGDEALKESVDFINQVMPDTFNSSLIPVVKAVTAYTLDVLDTAWEENKEEILQALTEEREFTSLEEANSNIENEIARDDSNGDDLPDSLDFVGSENNITEENNTTLSEDNTTIEETNSEPTITLNGDNPQIVVLGNEYEEAGAEAMDSEDGNLSVDINATEVNSKKIGDYNVTYSSVDSDNNEVVVKRLVQVVNPEILVNNLNVTETKCNSWSGIQIPNSNEYYTLSNNDWGRNYLDSNSDGVQCIFSFEENNTTKGGWYWGWPDNNDYQVKGYPEAIYGAKFSRVVNPDSGFPILVSDIDSVKVDMKYRDFNITHSYNIALEFWLHTDIDTSMDNIEYEIMFRFDPSGFHPSRTLLGTQILDGIEYDIYKDRDYDGTKTRTFINYVAKTKVSDIHIDFKEALTYLTNAEFADIPEAYMSGIEMGVEVISGAGVLVLDTFDVNLTQVDKNLTLLATPKATTRVYEEYQFKVDINSSSDYNATFYNAPNWLEFNKTQNIVIGTPPVGSEGNYSDINLSITNEDNITKSIKFNLEVQPAQNIAKLYGIASQPPKDDYYWYLEPSLAIDGDYTTFNHTQGDSTLNWIEVKLPQDTKVAKVIIYNRDDSTASRLDNAKLYLCENSINSDIANLSSCSEVDTLTGSTDAQIWENNSSISGDFVVIKADGDNNLHVAEIEAYGTLPTTPEILNSELNTTIDKWQNTTEAIFHIDAMDYQNDTISYVIANDVPFVIDESGDIRVDDVLNSSSYDINVTISDSINENSQIVRVDIQDTPIVKEPMKFNTASPTITGYLPNIYTTDSNITIEINGTTYTPIVSDSNWTIDSSDINPPLGEGDYNVTLIIDGTAIVYENYIDIYKSQYQKITQTIDATLIEDIDIDIDSSTVTPLPIDKKVRGSSIKLINEDGTIKLQNDSYRTLSSIIGRYKDSDGEYVYVRLNFSDNILPYSTNLLADFENSDSMEIFNTAGSFDLEVSFGSSEHECNASESNETKYCNPTSINDEVYSNTASEAVKDGNISEQEAYSIMLATFHHFYNSIDSLEAFRAWVYQSTYKVLDFTGDYQSFNDYQDYVNEKGFTQDSYINYHFMHMIVPDHSVSYLAMRYQYAAEGMASVGSKVSLFGYDTTSGWASLWEGTIDLNNPIDYDSFHHETMHTFGFSHDSGITYGWSHTFTQIVPKIYPLGVAPISVAPKYFFDIKQKNTNKLQLTFYQTSDAQNSNITVDMFSASKVFDTDFTIVKEDDDGDNQVTLIKNTNNFDRLILRTYADDSLEIASKVIDYKNYFLEIGKIAQDSNGSDYYAIGKQDWLNAYQVYEHNSSLTNFKTAIYDIYKGCRAILGGVSDVAYDANTSNIANYGDIIRDTIPTLKVVERKDAWYKFYVRDFSLEDDSDNWGDRLDYYTEPPIDDAYIMCIVPKE